MTIWFTSDTHFGHANIIKYCNRPFDSVEQMNETIVQRWNESVKKGDTVYHLGDVAWSSEQSWSYVHQLHGVLHLIRGNHDKRPLKRKYDRDRFSSIQDYLEIKVRDEEMDLKQNIVLMHYPIESWNKRHHGAWHIHGHCHGSLPSPDFQARVDVGSDSWGFRPVSYQQIKEHMTKKVFKPIDHHIDRRTGV